MLKLLDCFCCQSVDLDDERMDTRLFTRFPSTYHLRTLFDEYQAMSDSDNSENSEECNLSESLEINGLEVIIEGNEDNSTDNGVRVITSLHGSRNETESSCIGSSNTKNSFSVNATSGNSTCRSKQSKRNKRRSYRK
ncbi:hypothetical protein HWI79_1532 [Cryptosporidium felis]|nr:hypothetical protein HWI79_1532 [Cryptosporidium felis]